jgi:predicted Zn-dependent protease
MMRKVVKYIFILLLLMNFTYSSTAYTLQFTDDTQNVRLRWSKNVIPIAISSSLTKNLNIKAESDVLDAVRRSLETWEKVADIEFQLVWSDEQSVSAAGKQGDGISLITIAQTPENLILFGGDAVETAARTRIFFNRRGAITEADIVLNPYSQFSTDGTAGMFDLEATLTHEIGHLLGLEHSAVIGATMYEHQGKNGVYSLPNTVARSLAEDDIAGVRAIYGAKTPEENCCGTISGKISLSSGKTANDYQIWAEDAIGGRVSAGTMTFAGGKFKIEGLKTGKYRIYAQEYSANNNSAAKLGEFDVERGKLTLVSERITLKPKNFDFQFVGFNGQISQLAIPVNNKKSYMIYVAGKNLDISRLRVEFNSPYFSVVPDSLVKHDYGSEVSVFSFEVDVKENAQPGEYSFSLQSKNGAADFIVGGIVIEDTINPWFKYNFE